MKNDPSLDVHAFLLAGLIGKDPSSFIERQEARGQELVTSLALLPKKEQSFSKVTLTSKEIYESWGWTNLKDYDDLFYTATPPQGWTVTPTSHSMWNQIKDHHGRIRALYFYKAAFYDRDAFLSPKPRFTIEEHTDEFLNENYDTPNPLYIDMSYEERTRAIHHYYVIKDADIILRTFRPFHNGDVSRTLARITAEAWLEEAYPEYKNPFLYWE